MRGRSLRCRVTRILVVIPARNEELLLPSCLAALDRASARARRPGPRRGRAGRLHRRHRRDRGPLAGGPRAEGPAPLRRAGAPRRCPLGPGQVRRRGPHVALARPHRRRLHRPRALAEPSARPGRRRGGPGAGHRRASRGAPRRQPRCPRGRRRMPVRRRATADTSTCTAPTSASGPRPTWQPAGSPRSRPTRTGSSSTGSTRCRTPSPSPRSARPSAPATGSSGRVRRGVSSDLRLLQQPGGGEAAGHARAAGSTSAGGAG